MVVVATSGDECGLAAVALSQLEAEHAAVEGKRLIQLGYFEMNVPDVHLRVDASCHTQTGYPVRSAPPVSSPRIN